MVDEAKEDDDLRRMADASMEIIAPIFGQEKKRAVAHSLLKLQELVGGDLMLSGSAAFLLANMLAMKALVDNRGAPARDNMVIAIRESLPVFEELVKKLGEILGSLDRGPQPQPEPTFDAQPTPNSGGPVNL
jgi:hypothetical protein